MARDSMFTGIVEEIGRIDAVEAAPGLTRLRITAQRVLADLSVGDSIAINGTCLTVTERDRDSFVVAATPETLRRTNLGRLDHGDAIHLERALAASGRLGGHIVQGHVDAVGAIASRRPEGDSIIVKFTAPPEVLRYVVSKGSIAVDGVSLTVVTVDPDGFTVALIPHTQEATLLSRQPVGWPVNLEADILAKYVERAAAYAAPAGQQASGTRVGE